MTTLSSFRVLVVPGLYNSGPLHWQSRWQRLYPSFERVEQAHWDAPVLEVWSERMQQQLRQSEQPTLAIAHSFGCLTTVHSALSEIPNLAGALGHINAESNLGDWLYGQSLLQTLVGQVALA